MDILLLYSINTEEELMNLVYSLQVIIILSLNNH